MKFEIPLQHRKVSLLYQPLYLPQLLQSRPSLIDSNEKQVPAIRLTGNWLVENGFQTGRKFQVDEKPGSLTIRLILGEDERDVGG